MKHAKCYIPEYPRPQFVRRDWLNGEWKLRFGDEVTADERFPCSANVPFIYGLSFK